MEGTGLSCKKCLYYLHLLWFRVNELNMSLLITWIHAYYSFVLRLFLEDNGHYVFQFLWLSEYIRSISYKIHILNLSVKCYRHSFVHLLRCFMLKGLDFICLLRKCITVVMIANKHDINSLKSVVNRIIFVMIIWYQHIDAPFTFSGIYSGFH